MFDARFDVFFHTYIFIILRGCVMGEKYALNGIFDSWENSLRIKYKLEK